MTRDIPLALDQKESSSHLSSQVEIWPVDTRSSSSIWISGCINLTDETDPTTDPAADSSSRSSGSSSTSHESTENKVCCWLHGDSEIDQGQRVLLKLDQMTAFCFFPGQTVLLRGINPLGEAFIVEECLSDASLPNYKLQDQRPKEMNKTTSKKKRIV